MEMFHKKMTKTVNKADKSYTHTRTCCLTRVEQDDRFEADKLLGFEFEQAETGSGGQQHVEDLSHTLNTVTLVPKEQNDRKCEDFLLHLELLS